MSLDKAFHELIEALSQSDNGAYLVNWHNTRQWPNNTLERFLSLGLLHHAKRADEIICRKCINHCPIPVHIREEDGKAVRAFGLCCDSDMQEEMGILNFSIDQLKQWKLTTLTLAKVIHSLVEIEPELEYQSTQNFIKIGFIKNGKKRRALALLTHPLRLDINDHTLAITEVCYFEGNELIIDIDLLKSCASKPPKTKKEGYQKSTTRQQARKLTTEARNKGIQEEYRKLRKKYPWSSFHTDKWIAREIKKQGLDEDLKESTIIRVMKES